MLKAIFKETSKFLILIIVVSGLLFPLYYLVVLSLTSSDFITRNITSFVPEQPTLSNFPFVLDQQFGNAFLLTLSIALFLILFRCVAYTLAAFGLNKLTPSLRRIMFWFLIFLNLIPEITIYLALRAVLSAFNFEINSLIISLSANSVLSLFLLVYMYRTIKFIPIEQLKIMQIDNLNLFQKFWYVYFPNLKITYFLLIIFTTITAWNDFLWPSFVLAFSTTQTISTWFSNVGNTGMGVLFNLKAAASFISILVPLSLYLIFSKWINKIVSKNY